MKKNAFLSVMFLLLFLNGYSQKVEKHRLNSMHYEYGLDNHFPGQNPGMLKSYNPENAFLLDESVSYVDPVDWQHWPIAAFDGENYMLVWMDCRDDVYYQEDVYATRLDQQGNVLDYGSIPIVTGPDYHIAPYICFNGSIYLVAWSFKYYDGSDWISPIYCYRVNSSGEILDDDWVEVSFSTLDCWDIAIATDGSDFVIVWDSEENDDRTIRYSRVTSDGNVLDPDGIEIMDNNHFQYGADVSFDGTNYFAVWSDFNWTEADKVYGVRISPGGVILDPMGIVISSEADDCEDPSVAFDGVNFLVAWDKDDGINTDIFAKRISTEGVILDPTAIPVCTEDVPQYWNRVTYNGSEFLVVWEDYRNEQADIYGARVDSDGNVLDTDGVPIANSPWPEWGPDASSTGTDCLITWFQEGYYGNSIKGNIINQDMELMYPLQFNISTSNYSQEYLSVTRCNDEYMVVWEDTRGNSWDVYGTRVSQSGDVMDPTGIPIAVKDDGNPGDPAVCFGNSNYMVVWEDLAAYDEGGTIHGTRVAQDGSVIDPDGFDIATMEETHEDPVIAFDGENYMVVWEDYRHDDGSIYGTRVSPDAGVFTPNGYVISDNWNRQKNPAICFGVDNYLAVWQDEKNGNWDIYATRISTDGEVLDPNGIGIANENWPEFDPAIAFDGINYFVVWCEYDDNWGPLRGARVNQSGEILDDEPILISGESNPFGKPSVVFNGSSYYVVWVDAMMYSQTILLGATVSSQGEVLYDYEVWQFEDGNTYKPRLASFGDNKAMLFFHGWTDMIGDEVSNTNRAWALKLHGNIGVDHHDNISQLGIKCYPNPFSDKCVITYKLHHDSYVNISLFDINGKKLADLEDDNHIQGEQSIQLDGSIFNEGVYYIIISAEGYSESQKLVVIK